MQYLETKPSIVAFDLFAREPSIEVFCGGWGAAVIDATPQPANKQKRKIRFIRPPFHQGSTIGLSSMTMSTSTKDTLSSPCSRAYSGSHCRVVQTSDIGQLLVSRISGHLPY
jgi:hypothetical protein